MVVNSRNGNLFLYLFALPSVALISFLDVRDEVIDREVAKIGQFSLTNQVLEDFFKGIFLSLQVGSLR